MKYNLLNITYRMSFIIFKICYKTKLNIKKLFEFYKKYQFSFLESNLKKLNFINYRKLERVSIFNRLIKKYTKYWHYNFNYIKNYCLNNFNKENFPKFIKIFNLMEKDTLINNKNFLNHEKNFFISFFFTKSKVNLRLNSTLNLRKKKRKLSTIFIEKKKIIYIVHQKLVAFAPKCLNKQQTLKNFYIWKKF